MKQFDLPMIFFITCTYFYLFSFVKVHFLSLSSLLVSLIYETSFTRIKCNISPIYFILKMATNQQSLFVDQRCYGNMWRHVSFSVNFHDLFGLIMKTLMAFCQIPIYFTFQYHQHTQVNYKNQNNELKTDKN